MARIRAALLAIGASAAVAAVLMAVRAWIPRPGPRHDDNPLAAASADTILLATFDGAEGSTRTWREVNDPVMGGESTGTFTVDSSQNVGIFAGEVVDVPSLSAPGFIKAQTDSGPFPDISHCTGIAITAKASNDYQGFRFSFSNAHVLWGKFFAFGYKDHFSPAIDQFGTVELPFGDFTDYWDDATGEPIVECVDNPLYCPGPGTERDIKTMSVWAEGVGGVIHLELKEIKAYGCGSQREVYT